jgi:hypothetical protein
MAEITKTIKNDKIYFTDDTLRTLHLYARADDWEGTTNT